MCSERNLHVADRGCRAVYGGWDVADLLLGLRVRIPPAAWMSVSYDCCVLSGSGPCKEPIPRQEDYYRVCVCVAECDQV